MKRAFIATLFTVSSLLAGTEAYAKRIAVSTNKGSHLLEACMLASDNRDVGTKNYFGCCSKELGYCVLCNDGGQCYKFTNSRSFIKFQMDNNAPAGGKVIQTSPAPSSKFQPGAFAGAVKFKR
jgi:hypothetical protein